MKKYRKLRKTARIVNLWFIFLGLALFGLSLWISARNEVRLASTMSIPTQTPSVTPTPIHLPATIAEVKSTCSQGECLQACFAHVDAEFEGEDFPTPYYSGDDVTLVYYGIKDDELVKPRKLKVLADLVALQENVHAHRNIWDYFRSILPIEDRPNLVQFVIYASSTSYGQYDETLSDNWLMYFNILTPQDATSMSDTLIHEYGHYLTIHRNQMDLESRVCHQEASYGCPKPDSYFYLFFLDFWKDIYPEWKEIEYGSKGYEKEIELFYEKYKSRFINQYASTDPIEDIAESWDAFVIQPTPSGNTTADQKIKFFYQFPELVELRYQIITGICTYKQTP